MSSDVTSATTTTDPGRKVWQKNLYDVADQTTANATNVGFVRQNDSRVDVISTMDKGMTQQVFSFQNVTTAKTQLSSQGTSNLRVQVLNQGGQVIADSKSGMGAASKAYTALTNGTYNLKAGTYYVSVQRQQGAPATSTAAYNFQVKQGSTVKNDYITQAAVMPAKTKQEEAVSAVQQVAPTVLSTTSSSVFGSTSSDPFGLGGYNIFGVKT